MSLKTFHIIFITISSLFTFGFAYWLVRSYSGNGEVSSLIGAVVSTLFGVGLIVYGVRFLKKLQHVRFL